jgi:hypothetical protein
MAGLSANGEMREIDQRRRERLQHNPQGVSDSPAPPVSGHRVMSFLRKNPKRQPEDWTPAEGWLAVVVICMFGLTSAFAIAAVSLGI